MNLSALQRFATTARRDLLRAVADRLDIVLADGSPESLSRPAAVAQLRAAERKMGRKKLVDTVAYTWFNRFCALRFMDARGYTGVRVVSPASGSSRPELLAEAMAGSFEPSLPDEAKSRVTGLLNGTVRSRDPHNEAYRLLFLAACNAWSASLPFLFEKLDDWTELLLPADLLSPHSVLAAVREAMDDGSCSDVEIIGWLYQFYIAERKDEVFDGFQKGRKAAKEDIPAATELFTPRWIVRFLVQNSLGRLWLRTHPESRLREKMEYFVPDDPDAPKPAPNPAIRPENLRMCDPCCGSGHMLVQGFDLLFDIYLECGYGAAEIPKLVLENNLVGLDLDPRAASLSAFALAMKAREHDSRFLAPGRGAVPRIHALLPVSFGEGDLDQLEETLGKNNIPRAAWRSLGLFGEADNLGSLIEPEPCDWPAVRKVLQDFRTDNLFLKGVRDRALDALALAEALAPQRYAVVVTNPPYMGSKNMNSDLKEFAKKKHPDAKADLFAMFIERCRSLTRRDGFVAMVTMQSWMFLSSFERLRAKILDEDTILAMAHLGARAFDTIGGEVVSTTAFVLGREHVPGYAGAYLRLVDGGSGDEKQALLAEAVAEALDDHPLNHPITDNPLDHPIDDNPLDHPIDEHPLDHPLDDNPLDHPIDKH